MFFRDGERRRRSCKGLTEVKYWIINPEEIRYLPPKNSSEFSKFISSNLNFQKKETGLKTSPLFTIKGIDSDSKEEYLYEGNYNVKNLFTELSVISTKSITAQLSIALTRK